MPSNGATTVVLILAAVFLGLWLRPLGHAWWALFVTLALAFLQGFSTQSPPGILSLRMEEIAIGAVIGVAVTCSSGRCGPPTSCDDGSLTHWR